MDAPRTILHVDMDAFFASVEQRDDPSLRGKPVLVGHDGPRGVVTAASYESRVFGCRSAQPMAVAKRLCPDAIVVRGRREAYRTASKAVFAILDAISPLVQPLSIDEAFLDATGLERHFGPPVELARRIKQLIREATDLPASVGVAPNKFLAKLASDWEKPDGLVVIERYELPERLAELPIRTMWGVGPAAEKRMFDRGVRTFGDLQRLTLDEAVRRLGAHGEHFWKLARGLDDRPVTPDREAKSIGHEHTFGEDLRDPGAVEQVLLEQTEQVTARMRRAQVIGRTVTVKIRTPPFETRTRAATLDEPTDRTDLIWRATQETFREWANRSFEPVRLIGVSMSRLAARENAQLPLFGEMEDKRQHAIDEAVDAIRERFGKRSIGRGLRYTDAP